MLDPVLERQVIKKGKNYLIDVGGTTFDYDANFNMFLTCRLGNPSFSPELSAKVTIIDFTVTQGGLE
jgi:dynein heavy chain